MSTIKCKVEVKNTPYKKRQGFMVARKNGTDLWYYGTYESLAKAKRVAEELGNGVILEV